MGIYIKGMEMPTSCADCELAEHYDRYGPEHYCPFMGWYADYAKCPLIPVPPHGRLIDADALCDGLVSNHPVVIHAKSAPTIIPAEEE